MRKLLLATVCFVISVALIAIVSHAADPSAWDSSDYCGILPSPEEIPAIPKLSKASKDLGARMVDFYIFTRHGDRSTLVKNCWSGLPEYKNRVWTECPYDTIGFHSGLKKRNSYAPTYAFPIHPFEGKQVLPGNCHLGQLTQKGLLMSHNNGKRIGTYLESTFISISREWSPKALQLRSTDVHRTRETAEGFITGLLDTMHGTPEQLSTQLPPLTFVDVEVDALRLNTNVCKTAPYTKKAYDSDEWKKYLDEVWNPLTEELKTVLKQPTANIPDAFDCIKPMECHQQLHPVPKDLADRVEAASTEYYRFTFEYDKREASQLFTGALMMELSAMWTKSAAKSVDSDPTVYLYSGHDFGPMMNLVSALSLPRLIWPPYSAMMNVEFLRTTDKHEGEDAFVRFLYLGEVIIPTFCADKVVGDELCSVKTVLDYVKTVLPTADQCPGIPRASLSTFLSDLKQGEMGLRSSNGKPSGASTAAANIIEQLHQFDQDLKASEEAQLFEYKEKTHVERWSELG